MSPLKYITIPTLVVVLGIASSAQNTQTPPQALPGAHPPECLSVSPWIGVQDPDCTKANHPRTRDEKGGTGETGPYEVVPGFFKPELPKGWALGRVGGIFAESPDRIYMYSSGIVASENAKPSGGLLRYFNLAQGGLVPSFTRREYVLTIFDRNGKQIDAWKHVDAMHSVGSTPHRVRISPYDPEKHVWLIDEGRPPFDQILKFTNDGKLVMKVEGKASTSDIAFLPNGDFYALQRGKDDHPIIKYSKDGKEIGRLGPKGSTNDAHCIAFDKRGRIYVGEMANGRVQVFDPAGNPVDMWPNIRVPNYCAMDRNEHLWVFDSDSMSFLKYDLNGRLLSRWGTLGYYPGRFTNVNQFHVDSEGNLYTAEPVSWRPQLLRPKKGAMPDDLIAPFLHEHGGR